MTSQATAYISCAYSSIEYLAQQSLGLACYLTPLVMGDLVVQEYRWAVLCLSPIPVLSATEVFCGTWPVVTFPGQVMYWIRPYGNNSECKRPLIVLLYFTSVDGLTERQAVSTHHLKWYFRWKGFVVFFLSFFFTYDKPRKLSFIRIKVLMTVFLHLTLISKFTFNPPTMFWPLNFTFEVWPWPLIPVELWWWLIHMQKEGQRSLGSKVRVKRHIILNDIVGKIESISLLLMLTQSVIKALGNWSIWIQAIYTVPVCSSQPLIGTWEVILLQNL